jgi:diacylglycerol kinase family enzyme
MLRAAIRALRDFPLLKTTLVVDGRRLRRRTPVIFVGNNAYEIEGARLGRRASLTSGQLWLVVAGCRSPFALTHMAFRAALGKLSKARDLDMRSAARIDVKLHAPHVRVALDGEVVSLAPPLQYCLRHRSLRVIVPAGQTLP